MRRFSGVLCVQLVETAVDERLHRCLGALGRTDVQPAGGHWQMIFC